jgi:hypothetical protein
MYALFDFRGSAFYFLPLIKKTGKTTLSRWNFPGKHPFSMVGIGRPAAPDESHITGGQTVLPTI